MGARPISPSVEATHIAAPLGGINTISPAGEMPSEDSIYCWNMIAAEYGLRSRLGYQEWVTGLTGAADTSVRSIVPFTGSHKNGSSDKLFAVTEAGIWDVSASTVTPSQLVTFSTQTGDAGYGISTVVTTPGGRFLVYCDEENGAYVWSENGSAWTQIASGVTQLWAPTTFYLVGNEVVNLGKVYVCTTQGASAGSGGPTGTGTGITDGTAVWNYVSAITANAIGPSLADQTLGYTGSPANFAFVTVWKSRIWFVEKDTSRAWYLPVGQIYGTATSFDFGYKMRAGGPLCGLFNWSYDGGAGIDTLLVGISVAGDVVIYQGTDPATAGEFGLKGTWYVGAVPYGRRIATDYGGDVLVLSTIGVMPLSKLVIGDPIVDRTQYATAKISNLFNQLASVRRSLHGWSLRIHPTDNALLITVPVAEGQPTEQLAFSFATKGWSRYRDLPMLSSEVWAGQLYFGTTDGRVCINAGYVDGVQLANVNAYTPVSWSVMSAYRNLANGRQKRIQMLRTVVESQGQTPLYQTTAKFNFDFNEPPLPMGSSTGGAGGWDSAKWDVDIWGGDFTPSSSMVGAFGMGRDVAIAVRGLATSRISLVGFDVFFDQGGLL